jgi:hypothetical protein
MRTGDIRSIPLAFWFFGLLAAVYAVLFVAEPSTTYDLTATPSLLAVTLGPLIFATIVAYVVPADRRIFWGAALLAVHSILGLTQLLVGRTPGLPFDLYNFSFVEWAWIFELCGIAVLGLGLGGVRTRVGRLALLAGLAVFVAGDLQLAMAWINNPPDPELVIPLHAIALSFVGGLTTVGWAFLLGVALDNRFRLFAIAAATFFALDVIVLLSQWLFTFSDLIDPSAINMYFLPLRIGTVVAWLLFVAAAVLEVPRRAPKA